MSDILNEKLQGHGEKPMSFIVYVMITGFFAGVFWSAMGLFSYAFHFTDIRPNVILEPWALGSWKKEWIGTILSILLIGIFSVLAAFLYYAALKKLKNKWIGVIYGIALFLLVFIVLNPIFPGIKPLMQLEKNTIITTVCLFIVYGEFVGYSISYEYENRHGGQKHASELHQE
ncbi:MAG: YqhR family membrane protein [Bacillota bacterium]|nr:YqhR family membrane protein [Bacillota bacterium]